MFKNVNDVTLLCCALRSSAVLEVDIGSLLIVNHGLLVPHQQTRFNVGLLQGVCGRVVLPRPDVRASLGSNIHVATATATCRQVKGASAKATASSSEGASYIATAQSKESTASVSNVPTHQSSQGR